MDNPFASSDSQSDQQNFAALPLCFVDKENIFNTNEEVLSSPIQNIDLHSMSQCFDSKQIFTTKEQIQKVKEMQKSFIELRAYTTLLEERSLEMAMQLEKERLKSQQVGRIHSILKSEEEMASRTIENRNLEVRELRVELEKERKQVGSQTLELQNCKAENEYIKGLIMIANDNFEQMQQKHDKVAAEKSAVQEQLNQREIEFASRIEQIKEGFSNMASNARESQPLKKREEQNYQSTKSCKKELDDTYRKFFAKTLKGKKELK